MQPGKLKTVMFPECNMKSPILLFLISILVTCSLQAQNDSYRFPVSLSSFEASISNNVTKLIWKTECYLTYANFQVQSSMDAKTFTTINSFIADRLRCQQPFEFIDSSHYNSATVYYRVNAGDIDGHFYHSKIIKINKKTELPMVSVYPTLVNSTANIVFSSPYNNDVKIDIINSAGALIKKYTYRVKKGVSNFNLNLNSIPKGIYWITSVDTKGALQSTSIIKQ